MCRPIILLLSLWITDTFSDPGAQLFLSPYIETGNIRQGQEAAYINSSIWGIDDIHSYGGYFTVNKSFNSNLFFWYFPSEVSPENAPVVIWLNGGPGVSSLFGLFEEHGAFYIELNGTLKHRTYAWSKMLNMIYIDSPVGTGFSFTESEEGYARDEERVGEDLYSAVRQFFELFPELGKNDLLITGESYAGKYIPALAHIIHKHNKNSVSKINLKGIAIGNGLIDPESMMEYADHFYHLGLIDDHGYSEFKAWQKKIIKNIKNQNYRKACDHYKHFIMLGNNTLFSEITGFTNFYNFLHENEYTEFGDTETFLNKEITREAIHVGNREYNSSSDIVQNYLAKDLMKSVKPWFEEILEHYRVLLYSGQLDLIVPHTQTQAFLKTVKWSASDLYRTAKRKAWYAEKELAGYTKTAGLLTEVLVRNSGHMVPTDQPKWAFDLITRFAFNKPF